MARAGINSFITLNDTVINDLAADWYVMMLHFNVCQPSDEQSDMLIDSGIMLKRYLQKGAFTYLDPMNVYVDTDLFFDIWLEADGDIQFSKLYGEGD